MRPTILAAIRAEDLPLYPAPLFTLLVAHTTADALECLRHAGPNLAVVDWDAPGLDGPSICGAATGAAARVIVTTTPAGAPGALKAGCHEVLLRPLTPSLVATRIGRLLRAGHGAPADDELRKHGPSGTYRVWPELACTRCGTKGATSFEFASHRRMWYACLACDHVWVDIRRP